MPRAQKKRTTKTTRTTRPVSQDDVAREAFRLYQARHGAPGDPVADWFEAERICKARATTKTTARAAEAGATAGGSTRRVRTTSRRRR